MRRPLPRPVLGNDAATWAGTPSLRDRQCWRDRCKRLGDGQVGLCRWCAEELRKDPTTEVEETTDE